MTKTYMVIDHEGEHEYNIVVKKTKKDNTKYSIYRSKSANWHQPGEFIMSITSTDDGIKFNTPIKSLAWDDLECLRLLINFDREIDDNPMNKIKHKIIEDKVLFEI